jgi:curved DNA-binding protein
MAVKFRDYYETLGVDKKSGQEEIRKAFRKLARKYHPDTAAPEEKAKAEDKFKEINEAYEVLGDPEKRKKYDQLGANWQQAGGQPGGARGGAGYPGFEGFEGFEGFSGMGGGRGVRGQEFHFGGGTGFSDFFEQFFGGHGGMGMGGEDFSGFTAGRGAGSPYGNRPMKGRDVEGELMVTLDDVMRGTTRAVSLRRVDQQTGEEKTQTIQVKIPAGVRDGQKIRLNGQGGEGLNGGKAGDLLLKIRLARHPDFRVEGSDIYFDLLLAPWEAVLGADVTLPLLDGKVNLHVKPGTEAGQRQRLKGKGLPDPKGGTRGDFYVIINIQVPEEVPDAERELWEKLRDTSQFNPRVA